VPPIFLGAVQKSSRFDSELEDDFEGAEQTLQFDTERLRIFPEEYEMLKKMADDPDRILAKQLVFMVHEREIKSHLKRERLQ